MPPSLLKFGDCTLDLSRFELRRNGHSLKLEKIPMDLLILLVRRDGALVTREEIIETLWGPDVFVDTEQGINTAIRKIRQALHDDPDKPRYVQTVVGRGYRFVAPLAAEEQQAVAADAVAPVVATTEASPQTSSGISRRPFWMWGAALLAALGIMAGLLLRGSGNPAGASATAKPIRSIAVLPLENLSGDPAQEYFVDGMTDELITQLAKLSEMRVISRTSVMRYKGARKPLPEIARELKVDAIVEGTIVRSGSRVRVRAQLIRAAEDQHLWAETYERDLSDVLTLQTELASAIAQQVEGKLTSRSQGPVPGHRAVSPDVYEAYLRGRYLWNTRTEDGLKKGMEYFQQAIAKDTKYAPAYAGLADGYCMLGVRGYLPPREAFPKAKEAALKALSLDDRLAEAHPSLAIVRARLDWDWTESEKESRRAIELNPGYATAHHWLSFSLHLKGLFDESLAEMKRALELDPFSLPINTSLGTALFYARRYDQAIEQYKKALELDPNFAAAHSELGLAYEQKGMFEEAIAEMQKAVALSAGNSRIQGALGHSYAAAGRKREAEEILGQLKQTSKIRYVPAYDVALIYAGLQRKERVFEWLEKAFEERSAWLPWIVRDPRFDPIRTDPRYHDLVRRMGLPQ